MEVNLGAIRFNWKGAYAGATAYVADDVVSSGGASYICILASTGNAVSNATYWSIMSSAGTNGTDVGTTITTQGDLLFRDASGLQRLAKGTAAQVLAMNAGATAPEWQAAAGGAWNFVSSASPTSGAYVDFTLTTTYEAYVIVLQGVTGSNISENLMLRVSSDGGTSYDSGSTHYQWRYDYHHYTSTAYAAYASGGATSITLCYGGMGSGDLRFGQSGNLYINCAMTTGKMTQFHWHLPGSDNLGWQRSNMGYGTRPVVDNHDRIRFLWNNGTFAGGTLRLYGISNS